MAKILFVDDDHKLAALVLDWLRKENHTVEVCYDGKDAAEILRLTEYDVLVLDWNLPGLTGIGLCSQLRDSACTTPILMLTAKSSVDDKTSGLDAGADDYLTKPFHLKELSARIRALIRRQSDTKAQGITVGNLLYEPASRTVYKDGRRLNLYPRELALLDFLIRHPNQLFTLEALQKRVWRSDSEATPEVIRVHVARLRGKIDNPGEPSLIRTIHRSGYVFEPPKSLNQ